MPYFVEHQDKIELPIGLTPDPERLSLRRGQRGALHAIAAHFAFPQEHPALVVMPTGSGKTAVLMLAPFLLEAERVLVITPSRLVRYQIVDDLRVMGVLKRIGVARQDLPEPNVKEISQQIRHEDDWESIRTVDVAVAIPSSISPAFKNIPDPPDDLFDLVLVDEAHHSPAATWNALLKAFPNSRRVLFTATPFRRDEREIEGRFVFTYPISEARKEGIFSRVDYVPVQPSQDGNVTSNDLAIALQAEQVFREDQAAGFQHSLMVRTDERKRAETLVKIYEEHTTLNLRVIHSGLSYRTVRRTVEELQTGAIDGVICVDMLGEGFDLPRLKIAAIHEPHKSLAVTLQFVGRFARAGEPAKFVAVTSAITLQSIQLYEESADWQDIVPGLLEDGIANEVRAKRVLESFDRWERPYTEGGSDTVSLFALHPYFHVRVYEVAAPVDLDASFDLGSSVSVDYRWTSGELSTTIFITSESTRPCWTTLNLFPGIEHDLFIVHRSDDGQFLFVCASRRDNEQLYEKIVDAVAPNGYRPISQSTARKALLDLKALEQFMVGMRNPMYRNRIESYRMIAGSSANQAIMPVDGQTYLLGHSFGRALDQGEEVTIGWSSSGKVWSNTSGRIPEFLEWCDRLATRLASTDDVVTGSELDLLRQGERVESIPIGVISAEWDPDVYTDPFRVHYWDQHGVEVNTNLLNLELQADTSASDSDYITFNLVGQGMQVPIEFRINANRMFSLPAGDRHQTEIVRGRYSLKLVEYLNSNPPAFFFWDFSYLIGDMHYPSVSRTWEPFDAARIEAVDWAAENVDIRREFGTGRRGARAIHTYLEERLIQEACDIVYYDHGSLEIADFITVKEEADHIQVNLYHCKGSGSNRAGRRVSDMYEVCGQVKKSMLWVNDNERLRQRMEEREQSNLGRFKLGNLVEADRIVEVSRRKPSKYCIAVVQPGLSQAQLTPQIGHILGAVDIYAVRCGCDSLRILASA